MTFWQGFVIQIMGSLGMVNEKAALQIQNLLICIEMLIASLAHFYIFPYHEWQEGYKREKEKNILLRDTLALRDFVRDMRMMVTTWDPAPETSQTSQSAMEERTESPNLNMNDGIDYEDNGKSEKERGDSNRNGNGNGNEFGGQDREGDKGIESSDHIGISMIDILPINPSRTKNETTSLPMEPEHNSRNYSHSQGFPTSTTTTTSTSFLPPSSDTKNRPLKKSTSTSTSTSISQQEGKGAFEYFNPLHFPTITSMSRLSGSNSYTSIPDDEGTWTESLELKSSENSRVLAAAIGSIDKNILELKSRGFDVGPDINKIENKDIEKKNNVTLRNFNSHGNDKITSRKIPNSTINEVIKNSKVSGRGDNNENGAVIGKEIRGGGVGGGGGGVGVGGGGGGVGVGKGGAGVVEKGGGMEKEKGDEMFLTSSDSSRNDIAYSFNSNSDDCMDGNTQQAQSHTWQSRLSLDKELNNTSKTKNENNHKNRNIHENENKNNDNSNDNNYSSKGPQEQIPSSGSKVDESVAIRKRSWSSSKKKKSEKLKRESYSSYEGGEEGEDSDDDEDDEDDEGDSESSSSSNSERDDDNISNNHNAIHKKKNLPVHTKDDTSSATAAQQTAYFPFNAFTPSQPPILHSISTETESSWRTADDEARTEGTHVHTVSDLHPDSGSDLELNLESATLEPSVRTVASDKALLSSQQPMNNTVINRKKSLDREGKGVGMGEKKGEREEIEEEADVYKQIYNSYDDYHKTDTTRYEDVGVKRSGITGPKSSTIDPQRDIVVMTSSSASSSSSSAGTDGPRTNLESDVRTAERTSLQHDSVTDQRNGQNSSPVEVESGSRSVPVPVPVLVQGDGTVFGLDLLEEESV